MSLDFGKAENTDNSLGIARWAIWAQIIYVSLSALWNLAGVYLLSQGGQPLGPVANFTTALFLAAFVPALILTARYSAGLHLVLSVLIILASAMTLWGAFTLEASNWPSPFWRIAGAGLNLIGLIGALGAIASYFRR